MRFVLLRLFRSEKQGKNEVAFTVTKIESTKPIPSPAPRFRGDDGTRDLSLGEILYSSGGLVPSLVLPSRGRVSSAMPVREQH